MYFCGRILIFFERISCGLRPRRRLMLHVHKDQSKKELIVTSMQSFDFPSQQLKIIFSRFIFKKIQIFHKNLSFFYFAYVLFWPSHLNHKYIIFIVGYLEDFWKGNVKFWWIFCTFENFNQENMIFRQRSEDYTSTYLYRFLLFFHTCAERNELVINKKSQRLSCLMVHMAQYAFGLHPRT